MKDKNNPTNFTSSQKLSPPVPTGKNAGVVNSYAERVRDKMKAAVEPRGGPPLPPVPLLTGPAAQGTMADTALLQRQQVAAAQHQNQEPPRVVQHNSQQLFSEKPLLYPNDLLPEEAMQDPAYSQGVGANFAITQPHLATKYGVIRNGKRVPAYEVMAGLPGAPKKGLRPATIEGLKELANYYEKNQTAETQKQQIIDAEERDAEKAVENSAAGVARTPPTSPNTAGERPTPTREDVDRALRNVDDLDMATLREMVTNIDVLNNSEQKKLIEEKLLPINVGELIMKGRVYQEIPVNEHLYFTLMSSTAVDDLAVKRLILTESPRLNVGDMYYQDKYRMMCIALGVYSIGGRVAPSHLDKDDRFSDDLFLQKFNYVTKHSLHVLASIGIHYFWFEERVRKMCTVTKLKNG